MWLSFFVRLKVCCVLVFTMESVLSIVIFGAVPYISLHWHQLDVVLIFASIAGLLGCGFRRGSSVKSIAK